MTDTTATPGTGDQDGQQQTTAPAAQNTGQDGTGQPGGTPTPRDLNERGNGPHSGSDADGQGDEQQGKPLGDLDPAVQRELDQARADAGRYRQERTQAQEEADQRVRAILKAAGIDTGENDDPEAAAKADREAREQAEADARTARVELAVHRAAADPALNADATALLDSRSFQDRVKDLDPTDTDALLAAVKGAVADNPRLAATQAAARSSADFTGGSGDGAITQEKFDGMDMGQRNELYQSDPDTYRRLAATK